VFGASTALNHRAEDKMLLDRRLLDNSTIVVSQNQISSALVDETVILNLKSGVYHGLNQVATTVWNQIQQPRSFEEIRDAVLTEYEVSVEECDRHLRELLEDLASEDLVEVKTTANI
jgi:Coenzyme PQQ synthesis protein D (PqqD)